MTEICFASDRVRDCDGRMTTHHIVPKSRLVKKFPYGADVNGNAPRFVPRPRDADYRAARSLSKIKRDERNLIRVCWGHHQLIESAHPNCKVEITDLPQDFWSFVTEYGLAGELPRHLQEVAAL